jgi:hypothetical protein
MSGNDRCYDLTVTGDQGGDVVVEENGVDANGEQVGELKGSVPATDLALISRLPATAAAAVERAAVPVPPPLEQQRSSSCSTSPTRPAQNADL